MVSTTASATESSLGYFLQSPPDLLYLTGTEVIQRDEAGAETSGTFGLFILI